MKTRGFLIALIFLLPSLVLVGRPVQIQEPGKLVAEAKLVFVGRVKAVKPSKVTTKLSYIPYNGATFRWLNVDVDVIEPFKGVRKGDVVHTAMLSVDSRSEEPNIDPPGMLGPHKGDNFFFCLGATPQTNVFASLMAPYDENLSVFSLYRANTNRDMADFFDDDMKPILTNTFSGFITNKMYEDVLKKDKIRASQYSLMFSLVDSSGEIVSTNVQKFRQTFAREMAQAPSTNLVYLEWEKYTNPHGWSTDVPKGYGSDDSKK